MPFVGQPYHKNNSSPSPSLSSTRICYKDRNKVLAKNLETLYLLSLLKSNGFDFDETVI